MNYYLAKTEPSTYSIDDLQRDKRTTWDGVTNPQAVKTILQIRPGDRVFLYHSGGISAVVGMAVAASEGRPDPKNPKSAVVELEYRAHLDPAISLAEIKSSKLFENWALVRQGRLSTMPAPQEFVDWIRPRYAKGLV